MTKRRVLVADDDRAVLDAVKHLLEPEFEVVAAVEDGNALLAAVDVHHPDLVVTDISMPGLNGFEAARRLKNAHPEANIIFLTVHEESGAVSTAMEMGVNGYVVKRSASIDLVAAVREVLSGHTFVSAVVRD